MKILLSAYACEPHRGSERGRGWNWAINLATRGHEVHVLTRYDGKSSIERELSTNSLDGLHFHFIEIPIWLNKLLMGQLGIFLHYYFWQRYAYLYARKLSLTFDLVHHVTWGSLHGGSELWKLHYPFIFGPIGGGQVALKPFLDYFEEDKHKELIRTFITNNLLSLFHITRHVIKNSDVILVINQETKKIVESMNAKKVQLFSDHSLPDNYPVIKPHLRTNHEELRLLWVGRVYPRKGLNLILKTLQQVTIPYKLNIVGDGPWGSKIPHWIEKYHLSGKVNWYGWIPWDQLMSIYQHNDVFIFTSLRESFGIQLWEAMSFGLPIITLDCFGAHNWVPNNVGIKVPVKNHDETIVLLSKAITHLWKEPNLRSKMGKAAIDVTTSNNWSTKMDDIEEIYNNVIKDIEK